MALGTAVRRSLATALTLSVVCSASRTHADTSAPNVLDVTLLRSDAIVFATVSTATAAIDDELAVDIGVTNVVVVGTRWQRLKLEGFRVAGDLRVLREGETSVRVPHRGELVVGRRYLLLLQGGAWQFGPFTRSDDAIYEVREDGAMLCAGGEIYGISATGFVCSVADDQVGSPLSESTLAGLIVTSLSHARLRRPELDAEVSSLSEPLRLERSTGSSR